MIMGKNGNVYNLPSKEDHKGGEGKIYILPNKKVVKIYSDQILNENGRELEPKLEFMVNHPPRGGMVNYMAWPIDIVYENGRFCGFVMNNLDNFKEIKTLHAVTISKTEDLRLKLQSALNLSMMVSVMHRSGYVIGDFNPKNIGYNEKGNICFYDNDSFQFTDDKGVLFRCNVQFPGYVAPEVLLEIDKIHRQNLAMGKKCQVKMCDLSVGFTKESDNFALATHIFQLMMNGQMPYDSCPEGTAKKLSAPKQTGSKSSSSVAPEISDQTKVKQDMYCFNRGFEPFNSITPDKNLFPPYITDLFAKAFRTLGPNEHRPTADEWKDAINRYSNDVIQCDTNSKHIYWKNAGKCPYCEASKVAKDRMSNPNKTKVIDGGSNVQSSSQFGPITPPKPSPPKPSPTPINPPNFTAISQRKKTILWSLGLAYIVLTVALTFVYYSMDPTAGVTDIILLLVPPIAIVVLSYIFNLGLIGVILGIVGLVLLSLGIVLGNGMEYWYTILIPGLSIPVSILGDGVW